MTFARLLAPVFALLLLTGAAFADPLSLNAISRYFNGLSTAQGSFTQINDDGTISTGQIYIRRPGRIRFEYNPPDDALVMAGGGQVAIFDGKSNQPPEQYPLKRTPLNLILERRVDLGRRGMVVGHTTDGTKTNVIARDPENPEIGTIQLVFTGPPVELRQWIIEGSDGSRTTVVLSDMKFGVGIPAIKFSIPTEIESRQR